MTRLRNVLAPAVIAATLVGTTVAASAAPTLTAIQTDTWSFPGLSGSTSLLYNGFTSSLGTLTDVYMTLNFAATVNDLVDNFTGSPQSVGSPTPLTATATTTVSGSGLQSAVALSGSVTTPGFVGTVPAASSRVGSTTSGSLAKAQTLTSALSGFVGGVNSITLSLSEDGSQGGSVPVGVFTGNSGSANGTLTIQYGYTPASVSDPEPASMLLLGAGMIGLGMARRRRR